MLSKRYLVKILQTLISYQIKILYFELKGFAKQ